MGKPEGFIKTREVHSWFFHGCPDNSGSLWLGLSPKIETFGTISRLCSRLGLRQSQKLRLCWEQCFTRQCGACCGRHGALDPLSSSPAWLPSCQKNFVCLWLSVQFCILIICPMIFFVQIDVLWRKVERVVLFRRVPEQFSISKGKKLTTKPSASSPSLGRQRWPLESVLDLAHSSACRSVWRWRWLSHSWAAPHLHICSPCR